MSAAREEASPKLVSFGKYLLLERIATGGMAEVWLGKTVQDGAVSDLLAIKRLLKRFSDDEEFLHMFVDEARIAGQLDHPGVVQIHELGKVGSSLYIAMEYVWGRDLLGILRRLRELGRDMEPATAAYLGARTCEALHFAHTATGKDGQPLNVVHRDVSPQNVIVSFDGKVKLIDFGIAKAASRSTRTQAGTLKGKVGYMSPEQVRGAAVDARSDQFALGTCLYEMITGRPLFSRANNYEAMELVREADVPPLEKVAPECPRRLVEIVTRALSKRPDDRYPSAHALQKDLALFLADVDPGYERFTLATWLRDIFRDEIAIEKARLDALDLIGRPALEPTVKKHTNVSTRLEIGAVGLFDDDEDVETQVFEGSPLAGVEIEVRPAGPYEVFFHRAEGAEGARASSMPARTTPIDPSYLGGRPARAGRLELGPYRKGRETVPAFGGAAGRDTVPAPSAAIAAAFRDASVPATAPTSDRASEPSVLVSDELSVLPPLPPGAPADVTQKQQAIAPPVEEPREARRPEARDEPSDPEKRIAAAENLVLDPAELNSQVIRALLPAGKRVAAGAGEGGREPTGSARREGSARRRALAERGGREGDAGGSRRRRARRGDVIFLGIAATFMLIVGAGASWWWLSSGATATVEIRTAPPVPATVLVDGALRGRTPARVDGLAPGHHTLSVIAEGYLPVTRELDLAPRTTAILELSLVPAGDGGHPAAAPP